MKASLGPLSCPAYIRPAKPSEASDLIQLVARTMTAEDALVAADNYANASANEEVFVAEWAGTIIGTCGFWWDPWLPEGYCGMYWFAVLSEYRKQGVGSALLKVTLAAASQRYRRMFVEASPEAAPFYTQRGFVLSAVKLADRFAGTELLEVNTGVA